MFYEHICELHAEAAEAYYVTKIKKTKKSLNTTCLILMFLKQISALGWIIFSRFERHGKLLWMLTQLSSAVSGKIRKQFRTNQISTRKQRLDATPVQFMLGSTLHVQKRMWVRLIVKLFQDSRNTMQSCSTHVSNSLHVNRFTDRCAVWVLTSSAGCK